MARWLEGRLSGTGRLWLLASGFLWIGLQVGMGQAGAGPKAVEAVSASDVYVPTMTFDVASVRQSPEAEAYRVGGLFQPNSTSLRITNFDARNLLSMAYGVRWDQIAGPLLDWHVMFNIEAKADTDTDERLAKLNAQQQWMEQQHMLQTLLADRFKLKVHWETREGPTYNLVVVKGGPKMPDAKDTPPTPEEIQRWGDRPRPRLYQQGSSQSGFDFIAHGATLKDITEMLSGQFGHPVADKTGLTGKYDFTLRYHGARLSDRKADDLDPLPTLDTAVQEKLGLKLETAKGPIQFLVIDRMEKPTEN